MTSRSDRSSKSPGQPTGTNPASHPKAPPAKIIARPLTPRPKLFYTLLAIFILWIAAMLTMYFTTVYHKTDVHVQGATSRAEKE
jgi:hypothetical protein